MGRSRGGAGNGQPLRPSLDWRALLFLLLLAAITTALGSTTALAAGAPQVSALWASEVGATAANLRTEVNPDGLNTNLRFEYIEEAAYTTNLGATPPRDGFSGALKVPADPSEGSIGAGTADQKFVKHLGLLGPNTTYDYRLVATNSAGTTISPEGSPRTFTTQETAAVFTLPDVRGWEMVSPVDKNGGAVEGFGVNSGGGVFQAAAAGGAITYSSDSSFGPEAEGAPNASQYISTRGEVGWSTQNITLPTSSGAYGDEPEGVPYQLFSTDLARGLLLNGRLCAEGEECPRGYSLRDDASGALTPSPEGPDLRFAGASPDLRHVVLSTCTALTPDATEQPLCESGGPNLYEWSEGTLRLVNRLGSDPLGTSDAHLAAQAGAISTDGSRVYFTVGEEAALYLREGEAGAKLVSELSSFQTASADGSIAFFTKAGHLYRYVATTEVTTDLTPGGEVQGVLGASENDAYLYYETAAGLFLWHEGTTVKVASEAAPENYPPSTGTARVSPDGTHLAFTSKATLSSYENVGEAEVYLYATTTATLSCVSCDPSGERPRGPSSIPGAIANGEGPLATRSYKPRVLTADGSRLFFDSRDALALQDTNNEPDVYEWEAQGAGTCAKPGGCIKLISSGRSEAGASFIDAGADGSDVFFLTDGSLVPSDPGSVDLYDAREGGGFPVTPSPSFCVGDACQVLPPEPEDPAPGTLPVGQGNSPTHFPKVHRHKHSKHHRKRHRRQKSHRTARSRWRGGR